MDTSTQTALSKAHQNLSDDLEKLAQLIEPVNDRALVMVSKAHRRLKDIQELVKSTSSPNGETVPGQFEKPPHLQLSQINPVLQGSIDDTVMHVSCVLRALGEVEYEGDLFIEEGDFRLGIRNILNTCESALNVHRKYGTRLPKYAILTDEEARS